MPGKLSNFKTAKGESSYKAAYEAALTLWPMPYESLILDTELGSTHIIASGPKDAPPLILLHGMNLSATMWFPNIADLSRKYRVYAVDTIGSASKSVPHRPVKNKVDFSNWLNDILDELGIENTNIIGHSHGGWLTLNFAISSPERVKRMVLLAPAATFLPFASQFYTRGIPTMLFPIRPLIASFMRWMSVEGFVVNQLFFEQFLLGMKYVRSMIRVWPTPFSDVELKHIEVPTLLLIGDQEVIGDPNLAVNRAKGLMQNIRAVIIPNANHGLPMEEPALVNKLILDYLGDCFDDLTK